MSHFWLTTIVSVVAGLSLLVIGVAQVWIAVRHSRLVARQSDAAERQAASEEAQLQLAHVQLTRERSAYLALAAIKVVRSADNSRYELAVYNGGDFPATEVRVWVEHAEAEGVLRRSDVVHWPMIAPGQTVDLALVAAGPQSGATMPRLVAAWQDGLGEHQEPTTLPR